MTEGGDVSADAAMKVCIGCGVPKSVEDAFYSSRHKDGRIDVYGKCKDCHNKHVADRRQEKIRKDPGYLKREAERVAKYRGVEVNRQRANNRSNANHEALSRLKARYPGEYEACKARQARTPGIKRSVALYRATRELRDRHFGEYKALYREALKRKGVT